MPTVIQREGKLRVDTDDGPKLLGSAHFYKHEANSAQGTRPSGRLGEEGESVWFSVHYSVKYLFSSREE